MTRGEGWVRDVVLMVGSSDVIMKEDSTQVVIILLCCLHYNKTFYVCHIYTL